MTFCENSFNFCDILWKNFFLINFLWTFCENLKFFCDILWKSYLFCDILWKIVFILWDFMKSMEFSVKIFINFQYFLTDLILGGKNCRVLTLQFSTIDNGKQKKSKKNLNSNENQKFSQQFSQRKHFFCDIFCEISKFSQKSHRVSQRIGKFHRTLCEPLWKNFFFLWTSVRIYEISVKTQKKWIEITIFGLFFYVFARNFPAIFFVYIGNKVKILKLIFQNLKVDSLD